MKESTKRELACAAVIFVLFLGWAAYHYRSTLFGIDTNSDDKVVVEDNRIKEIKIHIGDKEYTVAMADNKAAQEFAESTPFELPMKDLNGNEKYFEGKDTLLPSSHRVSQIKTGDLMLYQDNCIVLFYKDFETDRSYTRLGWVYDADDLAETLGEGDVTVIFTKD